MDLRAFGRQGQGFEQFDCLVVMALSDHDFGAPESCCVPGTEIAGSLERDHCLSGSVELQEPGSLPQPCGGIVGVDGERPRERLEGPRMLVGRCLEMRAEVRPAEVAGIEGFGLGVSGERFGLKAVDIVGHPQAPPHRGRSRSGADRPNQCFQVIREIPVRRIDARHDRFVGNGRFLIGTGAEDNDDTGNNGKVAHAIRMAGDGLPDHTA